MADLDVQPKKKTSFLPWLIAAIVLLLLILLLAKGCNKTHDAVATTDTTTNVAPAPDSSIATTTPPAGDWSSIDRNSPALAYAEVNDKNISVRGNDNYAIYSLGEDVLFESGSSNIRKDADKNLKQIAASINQRFKGGKIRIYGYTDSVGSKDYNKDLAQQRAEAVSHWLSTNGNFDSSKISLNALGEGQPVATNSTEKGRQLNRRVEVVAKKAQ